ncbi:helix-turn-helix transcriptional regulator [Pseudoclavibacter sp. VKM Ac-2888]|uniref:helix-turn-helix transcriptional regulator n=1 Tax=Pseudoclavibacter sp. VKM Ac-2888 TaxID=2783830 RepID=UPI00188B1A85|nr:helix-turn-helix transcriptional regulator [Pseudoclavibacter sp. VKM Ac-2888]MBF4549475.1 helix-turn-helix transcriptional regulator [Pseudoclavibacter sp. VKM Ac-2888]
MSMEDQAAERCRKFGWAATEDVDRSLVAEAVQDDRYGAGRAWSSRSSYELTPAPGRIYLVYIVEGGFDFTIGGVTAATEPGHLILFDGAVPTQSRTTADTARFVWHLKPTFLSPQRARFAFHEPLVSNNAPMRSLTSMTNAMLNAPLSGNSMTHSHLGLAIEHLVASVLSETDAHRIDNAAHRDGLFGAAQLVIDANFRDPDFTVDRLIKDLGVSARGVHVAFADLGTTPRREIERRRLQEVERLSAQVLTSEEVVELAGFPNIRRYKYALRQGTVSTRSQVEETGTH